MCGLVAALQSRHRLSREHMAAALKTIAHRGPDHSAMWFSSRTGIALGHARLSIIGLMNGDQPIFNADRTTACVVNGEFYGYRAIRDRLKREGRHFSTESDSEIALHLYDTVGAEFVHELTGEFALVVADERAGRLVAARDRFGIKPLFYTIDNGNVLIASEIKALLALGVPARWDVHGFLAEHFSVRTEQTIFANIRSVPPGCILLAENGQVTVKRYWDTRYPLAKAGSTLADRDAIDGFRSALDAAVADRLSADVEVACYLSGGIDSCSVLGLAQRRVGRPIKAFTIAFDDAMYDETELARKTTTFTGATFIPVPVTQSQIADAFGDALWHAERHMFNGHGVAKYLLSQAVHAAGIKVVFTGEGADEILAGYPASRRDLLLTNDGASDGQAAERRINELAAANASSRGLLVADGARAEGLDTIATRLGFVPSWIDSFATMAEKIVRLLRPEIGRTVADANPYRLFLDRIDVSGALVGRAPVNQALYLWNQALFPNYILTVLGDRMEMAHSVEGRVPFLDHRLTEFVAGFAIDQKIRGAKEKFLLREACRDVLIPEVYERQKHPFMSPPAKRDNDPMAEFITNVLESSLLDRQPFFDPTAVRSALRAATRLSADERAVFDGPLLGVVSTALLHERFGLSL